ncbi:uncharacterized protein LOC124930075 [Impatiens glandulifera]|uniref:uncharacterized protein LOC124930075 n=1 Tax=Impatiens glandulifera TaxID=253017 RepID=UPI001FB11DAF|nr:uncharacterized protein LOC124930075 [Impatiens glandulifera]
MAQSINQDCVCQMCGVEGFKELLVHCFSCGVSEHMYCMEKVIMEVPKEWKCDECQIKTPEMTPKHKHNGGMSRHLDDLQKNTDLQRNTDLLEVGGSNEPDDTPDHVDPTLPEVEMMPTSFSQPEGSTSKKKGRGKNKNTALSKLSSGEKITIEFSPNGRVCCNNSKTWSRHIGIVVQDPTVISHRLLHWSDLSSNDIEHLWKSVTNHFKALPEHIDYYRKYIMKHVKVVWGRYRCNINRINVKTHNGDLAAIRAHKPIGYTEDDWNYILDRHFLRDDFRVRSERNSQNRKNLQLTHHAGSVSFSQVTAKMVSIFILFMDDDSTRVVDPHVQEKIDAMRQTLERNPDMSNYELTENLFRRQRHGSVIGMGSGVRPTQFRGDLRGGSNSHWKEQDYEQLCTKLQEETSKREELERQMEIQKEKQSQMEIQLTELPTLLVRFPPTPPPDESGI